MDNKLRNEYHQAYIDNDSEAVTKMLPNFPKSVIKFFGGANHHLDSFANRQLWVTAPRFFNDPFDCAININYENSAYQVFKNKLNAVFTKESADKFLEEVKKYEAGFEGFMKFITYDYKKRTQEFANQIFVSCFSELSNLKSLRMWGHYADSHRGFCLEYSTYEIYRHESSGIFKGKFIECGYPFSSGE